MSRLDIFQPFHINQDHAQAQAVGKFFQRLLQLFVQCLRQQSDTRNVIRRRLSFGGTGLAERGQDVKIEAVPLAATGVVVDKEIGENALKPGTGMAVFSKSPAEKRPVSAEKSILNQVLSAVFIAA